MLIEVEHVKAYHTEKARQQMTLFEKFTTEGNEEAEELAKQGAMLDGGFVAQARASTIQQEREAVYAALQYAASFHCLVESWKDCEELQHKSKEKEKGGKEASDGVVCHS